MRVAVENFAFEYNLIYEIWISEGTGPLAWGCLDFWNLSTGGECFAPFLLLLLLLWLALLLQLLLLLLRLLLKLLLPLLPLLILVLPLGALILRMRGGAKHSPHIGTISSESWEFQEIDVHRINSGAFRWCLGFIRKHMEWFWMLIVDLGWFSENVIFVVSDSRRVVMDYKWHVLTWRRVLRTPSLS